MADQQEDADDALRAGVRRQLGSQARRLTDRMWQYLCDHHYVSEALSGGLGPADLAQAVREVVEATSEDGSRTPAPEMAPSEPRAGAQRLWALSQVVANVARRDPDVMAFRARYLADGLLAWKEFGSWIKEQQRTAGSPTAYVTIPLPSDALPAIGPDAEMSPAAVLVDFRGASIEIHSLAWAAPGDTWVRRIGTVAGTPLDHLRQLAEGLATAYAWTPAQAAVFVVTGTVPLISGVRVTVSEVNVRNKVDCAWARRIALSVDPALTPSEVAEAFAEAKRQRLSGSAKGVSAKHARLAAFVLGEPGTWQERLRAWNKKFPEWRYTQESNMRRDALRAQARLLYPAEFPGQRPLRAPRR